MSYNKLYVWGMTQRLETAGTFWLYGGICLAGLIFIRLRVPETKGKTLEQIERELVGGDPTPWRQPGRPL
jgi:hypothetical protein